MSKRKPPKEKQQNWINFGRWVVQKREDIGWTQEQLADKIPRDRQTIYRIESGEATKRPTVIAIAKALGEHPQTAIEVAYSVPVKIEGDDPLPPVPRPKRAAPGSIEEALRIAHFFHAKSLSEPDIAVIRPILEGLDRTIEKLKQD